MPGIELQFDAIVADRRSAAGSQPKPKSVPLLGPIDVHVTTPLLDAVRTFEQRFPTSQAEVMTAAC
jgi:hypothetical protein